MRLFNTQRSPTLTAHRRGNEMTQRADCTVRALAAAAGIAYELALSIASDAGRRAGGRFNSQKLIDHAKTTGLSFRKLNMRQKTLRRFLLEHPTGKYYCNKRGHAFAIIDGVVSDRTKPGARVLNAWVSI